MTSLRDKARAGGPEIVRVSNQPHRPPATIEDSELVDCDDLTPEGEFPEHGAFLMVSVDGETEYWETPNGLAEAIVGWVDENGEAITGTIVEVDEVVKGADGTWRYTLALRASETDDEG